ncbi:MAG: recombinase family protein, partial [Pseudomonadota bacterium]
MKRPGMVALLSYLDAQPHKSFVIIFDDLKRFAQDTEFHRKLRRELSARGAQPECLNFRFEDTPEGEFIETIMAAQGELERKQNRRQVVQKMRARIEKGYWVFHPVPGYRYKQTRGEGKVLVRDEPVAAIVQEALEGFASGRFQTQSEVKRWLEAQPEFPKQKAYGGIRLQKVTDMLTHPLYAGCVQAIVWEVSLRKGNHEGLISVETFERIQQRLKDGAYAPKRANIGDDFALRGFVTCADCEKPLRSSHSTSMTGKRHAYYLCQTKGCASYGKSIRRAKIEGDVEDLLKDMRPSASLFALARAMFIDAWSQRSDQAKEASKALKRDLTQLEKQMEVMFDRIADATSPTAIKAYERRIDALEKERLVAEDKLQRAG